MRKYCFFVAIFIIASIAGSLYAEELILSTYYPAPYGDYRNVRVAPIDYADRPVCSEDRTGVMYYDDGLNGSSPGEGLYQCDGVVWLPIRGVWQPGAGGDIYYNSGDVGIGTTDPNSSLEVYANDDYSALKVEQAGSGSIANFDRPGGWTVFRIDNDGAVTIQAQDALDTAVTLTDTDFTNAIDLGDNRIISTNNVWDGDGNVGIGTTDPNAKFVVDATGTGEVAMRIWGDNNDNNLLLMRSDSATPGIEIGARNGADKIRMHYDTADKCSVLQNWAGGVATGNILLNPTHGNIGIGLTNPVGPLHISAHSDEIDKSFLVLQDRDTESGSHTAGIDWVDEAGHLLGRLFANSGGHGFYFRNASDDTIVNIKNNGDVGIGTASPNYKLDVRGSIGNNTTLYHSDVRWKKNIQPISNALDMLLRLRGVNFQWKDEEFKNMNFDSAQHIGVIAQEVEQVIPQVVTTNEDGYKTVEYANLVALLIEAVKEQEKRIKALESREK